MKQVQLNEATSYFPFDCEFFFWLRHQDSFEIKINNSWTTKDTHQLHSWSFASYFADIPFLLIIKGNQC